LANEQDVEILSVERQTPLHRAGLRDGDLSVAFDEQSDKGIDDLHKFLAAGPLNQVATLQILRGKELLALTVRPVETK
jgi:S1-C subfamily serine protease